MAGTPAEAESTRVHTLLTSWRQQAEHAFEWWHGEEVDNLVLHRTSRMRNRNEFIAWCKNTFVCAQ